MRRTWTDDQIIQAMRDWEAIFGSPPKSTDWETADPEGLYPQYMTVRGHFGTWGAAVRAAFPPRVPRNPWTRERIVEALRGWADEHDGLPPSCKTPATETGLPSSQTVTRLFGSRRAAMAAAGLAGRPPSANDRAIKKYLPLPRRSA